MNVTQIISHLESGSPIDDLTNWESGKSSDGGHYAYRMRLANDGNVYGITECDFPMDWENLGPLEDFAKNLAETWDTYKWNYHPENDRPAIELVIPDGYCVRQYLLDVN